jgi:hypothetical protein
MEEIQLGTFNTMAQHGVQFGGDFPVWQRVDKLYQGGGYLDLTKFKAGDVIHAGTMVKYNGPGKQVDVITASGTPAVVKLTVTTGATSSADCTVVLGDLEVAVTLAASDGTDQVATKIKAKSFSGWKTSVEGSTVTFTQSTAAPVSNIAFVSGTSGAKASMEISTQGVAKMGNASDVNGLVFNDVCIPTGCTLATCSVVRAGRIYADRVANGGIPASVEAKLPMIEFVRES